MKRSRQWRAFPRNAARRISDVGDNQARSGSTAAKTSRSDGISAPGKIYLRMNGLMGAGASEYQSNAESAMPSVASNSPASQRTRHSSSCPHARTCRPRPPGRTARAPRDSRADGSGRRSARPAAAARASATLCCWEERRRGQAQSDAGDVGTCLFSQIKAEPAPAGAECRVS